MAFPALTEAAEELYEALSPAFANLDEGVGGLTAERINLIPNPSAKLSAAGLTRAGATEAVRVEDAAGSPAGLGLSTYFTTTGTGSGNRIGWLATLQAGRTYTFSVYVKATSITGGARVIGAIRTAAAASLVTSAPIITAVTGEWVRLIATYTPTETAEFMFTTSQNEAGTTAWAFTGAMVEEGTTASGYFDGDSPLADWVGVPDASASREPARDSTFPLARFCSVITSGDLSLIHEWVIDTAIGPGWQILLDPSRAPAAVLPWLAQFDGAVLMPRMSEAEERLTITSPQAFGRGTVEQIEEVAKRGLTGSKTVIITERYAESAWKMQIKTLPGETPEPARLKAEIEEQAKPIGIVLFFNEANVMTWLQLRERAASITWLKSREKYPTWLALRTSE